MLRILEWLVVQDKYRGASAVAYSLKGCAVDIDQIEAKKLKQ